MANIEVDNGEEVSGHITHFHPCERKRVDVMCCCAPSTERGWPGMNLRRSEASCGIERSSEG